MTAVNIEVAWRMAVGRGIALVKERSRNSIVSNVGGKVSGSDGDVNLDWVWNDNQRSLDESGDKI